MSGLDLLIPQSALWYMLLVATVSGVLLGVLCDGLFILRLLFRDPHACAILNPPTRTKRNSNGASNLSDETMASSVPPASPRPRAWGYAVLQGFCDLAAVLLATVILLLLCYYTSDGQLRAPAIFGMIVGFWGYHKTVSRLFCRLTAALVGWLCRCICFVWTHTLGRLLGYLFSAVVDRARRMATERRIDRLTKDAACGFGLPEEPASEQQSE